MTQASAALCKPQGTDPPPTSSIPRHQPGEPRPFSLRPVMELIVPKPEQPVSCAGRMRRAPITGAGEITTVALRLGVSRAWVYRCGRLGLGIYVADAVAIRLGVHPSRLWTDWANPEFERGPDENGIELRVGPRSPKKEAVEVEPSARPFTPWAYRPLVNLTDEDRRATARMSELSHVGAYRLVRILQDEGFTNPRTGRPWTKDGLYNLRASGNGHRRVPRVRLFECRRCGSAFEKVGPGRPNFCSDACRRPPAEKLAAVEKLADRQREHRVIVARVLELRGDGLSMARVAKVLESEGHRSWQTGRAWHWTSLYRLVREAAFAASERVDKD